MKTGEEPVFPTPTIGMLGLLHDKSLALGLSSRAAGDKLYLIGQSREDINSSEYLSSYHGVKLSPAPYFDLEEEVALHETIRSLNKARLIRSAHDVADGGLFSCLIEKGLHRGLGFDIKSDSSIRKDAYLFGESQSRVVVSVAEEQCFAVEKLLEEQSATYSILGNVSSGALSIDGASFGTISEAKQLHRDAITSRLR